MLKVGLTGGVACGKSTVGQMFVSRGAHLIQADQIAHDLMQPGASVYNEVVRRFGPEILNPDKTINRKALANAAFGSNRIQELNHLVHPTVIHEQERWIADVLARDPQGIAIVEAALILEAGVGKRFDKLVVVTCAPEQKIERFAVRHGISEDAARADVQRRSAAQLPDDEKARSADYVINNSGPLSATEAQVDRIWAQLTRLSLTTNP